MAEPVGWGVALLPAACLILLISVRPFQEPPVWNLTERVATGPWRGALTTTTRSQDLSTLAALVGRCPGPGHGVLVVGFPGGYLDTTCRFDTNALWVEARDGGTAPTRAWLERTGRRPDLVVISDRIKREAGGELARATGDPLGAWIAATYEQSERVPGFATAYRPWAG